MKKKEMAAGSIITLIAINKNTLKKAYFCNKMPPKCLFMHFCGKKTHTTKHFYVICS